MKQTLLSQFQPMSLRMRPLGLVSILLCISMTVQAQYFNWVRHMESQSIGISQTVSDSIGNIYCMGTFTGTADFNIGAGMTPVTSYDSKPTLYLAKYDSAGNNMWVQLIMANVSPQDLTIDLSGNLYIVGQFSQSANAYYNLHTPSSIDSFVNRSNYPIPVFMKCDNDGNLLWAKCLNNNRDNDVSTISNHIAVDSSGNVYLSGNFEDTLDFDPGQGTYELTSPPLSSTSRRSHKHLFIAKYDTDGNFTWAKNIEASTTDTVYSNRTLDIVASRSGDVIITGHNDRPLDFDPGTGTAILTPSVEEGNHFLARYDKDGNFLWVNSGGGAVNTNGGGIMEEDAFGDIYVTGFLRGTRDFDPGPDTVFLTALGNPDMFLAKYNAGGDYIWAKRLGSIGSIISPLGLAVSRAGNVYVTGYFLGNLDFNACPEDTAVLTAWGFQDMFIAQYDAAGNYLWAGKVGAPSPGALAVASGSSVTLDPGGNAYINGGFFGTVDFDPNGSITKIKNAVPGKQNAYLLKLDFHDTLPQSSSSIYVEVAECADSYTLNGTAYTETGIYTQFVPGSIGCSDSTIILDLTFIQVPEPVITVDNFTLGVTLRYTTYQWIKEGISIPGATDSTYTVTENGDYQVVVTDEYGCSDTSAIYTVNNTNIHMPDLREQIRIYPNPVEDIVYIQSPIEVNIALFDITGRYVLANESAKRISLKDLVAGLYLLQIKDKRGNLIDTVKIVKK